MQTPHGHILVFRSLPSRRIPARFHQPALVALAGRIMFFEIEYVIR